MEEPQVPLQVAAEHYRDAMRRGHNFGQIDFRYKALELLTQLAETGPFDASTKRGVKMALRAVKDIKLD